MKTAAQINSPQTGRVEIHPQKPTITISNHDPGQNADGSADLTTKSHFRSSLKGTAENIRTQLENIRDIPTVYKAVIVAELEAADASNSLWRMDIFRHPHGIGANIGFTLTALK